MRRSVTRLRWLLAIAFVAAWIVARPVGAAPPTYYGNVALPSPSVSPYAPLCTNGSNVIVAGCNPSVRSLLEFNPNPSGDSTAAMTAAFAWANAGSSSRTLLIPQCNPACVWNFNQDTAGPLVINTEFENVTGVGDLYGGAINCTGTSNACIQLENSFAALTNLSIEGNTTTGHPLILMSPDAGDTHLEQVFLQNAGTGGAIAAGGPALWFDRVRAFCLGAHHDPSSVTLL